MPAAAVIQDPDTEAAELENVLRKVREELLRKNGTKNNPTGLTYAQFKTSLLKKNSRANAQN